MEEKLGDLFSQSYAETNAFSAMPRQMRKAAEDERRRAENVEAQAEALRRRLEVLREEARQTRII